MDDQTFIYFAVTKCYNFDYLNHALGYFEMGILLYLLLTCVISLFNMRQGLTNNLRSLLILSTDIWALYLGRCSASALSLQHFRLQETTQLVH